MHGTVLLLKRNKFKIKIYIGFLNVGTKRSVYVLYTTLGLTLSAIYDIGVFCADAGGVGIGGGDVYKRIGSRLFQQKVEK